MQWGEERAGRVDLNQEREGLEAVIMPFPVSFPRPDTSTLIHGPLPVRFSYLNSILAFIYS